MATKYMRFYHPIGHDKWCHAWDIEERVWDMVRSGREPLRARHARLPNGEQPEGIIQCGTCGSTAFGPKDMRHEPVSLS